MRLFGMFSKFLCLFHQHSFALFSCILKAYGIKVNILKGGMITSPMSWYTFWAIIYDLILDRIFPFDRKRILKQIKGRNIVELGVGTGLNLPYYPKWCVVAGVDTSYAMLKRAKKKARKNTKL